MNLSSLVIPVLLSAVAVYGLGKRVDVYGALTHGAEEGVGLSSPSWSCWASRRRPRR